MSSLGKEDQLRRIVVELRLMQGTAETLQQRLQLLTTALADLRLAEGSMKDLKEVEAGTPILVPVGGGTFVNAQLGDMGRVIMGIGADVSVEMRLEDALENVSGRVEEVERAQLSVQQQLSQILAQMEAHEDAFNRLSAELQGEAPGV